MSLAIEAFIGNVREFCRWAEAPDIAGTTRV
jgi:hypothetical protein